MNGERPEKVPSPFFARTVLTFLAPLVLSMIILGFLSVRNTIAYVRDNIERVNSGILRQARDGIDSIIDELNIISLNFSVNGRVQYSLRRILQKELLDYEDTKELEIIQNMLGIAQFSRSFLQSIYVYFDNPKRNFLTSEMAVVSLDSFPDREWFESYQRGPREAAGWSEARWLRNVGVSPEALPVLTFYKLVYNSNSGSYNGLVVFNVFADHIRGSLKALETFDNQNIFILDARNRLVSSNDGTGAFPLFSLPDAPAAEIQLGGRTFSVAQLQSKYGYRCVSLVPNETLYRLPDYLFSLNILYVLISLVVGMALSLYLARRANRQIRDIIDIIRAAKLGRIPAIAAPDKAIRDSHQYILQNVLNTFLEKDFLQVQLSEKMYKSRVDELIALQSQINPHFLFNTLQTISMRAIGLTQARNEVTHMIEHLSLILRYSMSDPRKIVRVEEEIENARSYLAIQSIRYKDKISVRWEYEPEVLNLKTIKLLFQPLLENCIYHGIKEREAPGEIAISMTSDATALHITVGDTGAGIPPDKLAEIQAGLDDTARNFDHIGLYNTNRRIKLVFGEQYGLSIDSRLGVGTLVHIVLARQEMSPAAAG